MRRYTVVSEVDPESGDQVPAAYYLRIRSGAARKSAETIASGLPLAGVDPIAAAADVFRRLGNAGTGHPAWCEVLRHGESTSVDVLKIPPLDGAEPDSTPTIDAQGMLGQLVQGIVASNSVLSGRVNHLEDRCDTKDMKLLELAERAAKAEVLYLVEQERQEMLALLAQSSDAQMQQALALLEPVLKPLAPILASGLDGFLKKKKPVPPKEWTAYTPDEQADKLLDEMDSVLGRADTLTAGHPEVIGPRLIRMLAMTAKVGPIRDRVEQAMSGGKAANKKE